MNRDPLEKAGVLPAVGPADPAKHYPTDRQKMPTTNDYPPVQALVIKDMQQRWVDGTRKYGTGLQPHNGRSALVDLYQELLDACNYVRQLIYEDTGK